MQKKIRVLIADDHRMVREGLKAFFAPLDDIEIVAEARDGTEAVQQAACHQPDVILLDLMMPKMNGIEATRAIKAENPAARILIITSFAEDEQVVSAIRAGAAGYLLKDSSPEELHNAILDIHAGETSLSPKAAKALMNEMHQPEKKAQPQSTMDALTAREKEILRLVAEGKTNQEIADALVLSAWTVRSHVTHILNKLGLENRTQAALLAIREGLAQEKV